MSLSRSMSRVSLSTALAAALALAGCGAAGTDTPGSGGNSASGGSSQNGSGGSASGGASSGGTTGSGGKTSSGGSTASGGVTSSGGTTSSGGSTGSGGETSSGGATSSGGTSGGGGRAAGGGRTGAGGGTTSGSGGAGGGQTGAAGAGMGATGGAAGSSGGTPGKSAGCGKMPTIASSMYNNGNPIAITVGGKARRYILSVPTGYDNTKPYKLVIAWHQLDGNDKQMYSQNYYWLKDIAEVASSVIFVAPNGEKNGTPCTGNSVAESGCGWPDSSGAQIALADAVVAQVEESFCIDTTRIFAEGWSYGGSMSYRTACSRGTGATPFGVRAVAIYNGASSLSIGNCKPAVPTAMYLSHGTNDTVLSYDGGIQMAQTYAKLNGCSTFSPAKASGNHICSMAMGCMAGLPVEFCSYVGPHTGDPPKEGGSRWQPAEVWKFFSQF